MPGPGRRHLRVPASEAIQRGDAGPGAGGIPRAAPDSALKALVGDYQNLRDQVRACRGEARESVKP